MMTVTNPATPARGRAIRPAGLQCAHHPLDDPAMADALDRAAARIAEALP